MRVIRRFNDPDAFAEAAAEVVVQQLDAKPRSALALPTGNTPIGLYAALARRFQAGALRSEDAHVFNLDDYVGLGQSDPRSYAAFIVRHVVQPLQLAPENVRLLRGDAIELEQECLAFDRAIATCGGIDLCVLGLGVNGHVAFNEPGTDWSLATHVVHLSTETRTIHALQSANQWQIPVWGITMGIRTILDARAILLLVAGSGKETAKHALFAEKIDARFPVTCLTDHPNVTVIELCAPGDRH